MSNMAEPEIVEILPDDQDRINLWQPVVGEETGQLLETLSLPDDESRMRISDEAARILSKCVPPNAVNGNRTGLVVGYVQSGKTMSFTTVASLARDNNYQLIIVITGISIPLLEQSTERLRNDLRIPTRRDRKWYHFKNPAISEQQSIRDILDEWRDRTVPSDECRTILITVMKNHQHLQNLSQTLEALNLDRVPSLIIDDEADQASLNSLIRDRGQSTTYRRILELKNCLPHHTLLQYTATPQAPLLINIIDILSPTFAEVLTPGLEYVGGRDFFLENPNLIDTIPVTDLPRRNDPRIDPPESLVRAMQFFFIGVACGIIRNGGEGNRSMMVHPSLTTIGHEQYHLWTNEIRDGWMRIFALNENEQDRQELLEDFRRAYNNISTTENDLPQFEEVASRILHAIRRTEVKLINATRGRTPTVEWNATYPFILVGGQAMDRGFTVEGLTITYMPRRIGVGQADTIQQRGRFFGYKRRYLGYCRVFLDNTVRDAYRNYIAHEEDVRNRLIEHRDTGQPLYEWKRAFFLNRRLKPTRDNVLDLDYQRERFGENWYTPRAPHDTQIAVDANREVIDGFLAALDLIEDPGSNKRTEIQRNLFCSNIPLNTVYEELLTRLRLTSPTDSQQFMGLELVIKDYLDQQENDTCTIYLMSKGAIRTRSINNKDEIITLFSGAAPVEPRRERGSVYPGDRAIRASRGLTVQIHRLNIQTEEQQIVAQDVPTIAVWVPGEMAQDIVIQNQ
jgi:hypothetical protein